VPTSISDHLPKIVTPAGKTSLTSIASPPDPELIVSLPPV